MPDGKTHDRITYSLLPLIIIIGMIASRSLTVTAWLGGAYLFGGLMFGPDLDIHSIQYKRWGWLRPIWLPYRTMLRHRSFLSHGPVVGTLFRIFYLGSLLLLGAIIIGGIVELSGGEAGDWGEIRNRGIEIVWHSHRKESIAVLIGLELGAMSHSISDWIGSALKRSHRKTRKKTKR